MDAKPGVPLVYWAQSQDQLFLRVELEAKSNPVINTSSNHFEFTCDGVAPGTGRREYAFQLDLQDEIIPGSSGYRMDIGGSKIQFFVQKAPGKCEFWPKLLSSRSKPAWLKIDFDRFQSGEAESEEEKDKNNDPNRDPSMRATVDDLLKDLKDKKPRMDKPELDFKRMYLTAYNTFMFLGFLGVMFALIRNYVMHGSEFIPSTFATVGSNIRLLQFSQALEVIHASVGLVRSSPVTALLQTVGRLAVFHMLYFEPEIQTMPAVFGLFLAWSMVEVIRYPYYLCQVHGVEPKFLKYLRYTSWIVLYPMGMFLETVVMIRAIETYHATHPRPIIEIAGLGVTWSHVIGAYLVGFPVGCFVLLRHMFSQSKAQLLGGSTKKHSKAKKA